VCSSYLPDSRPLASGTRAMIPTPASRAAREFTQLVSQHGPEGATAAQVALAWVAQLDGVSTVIPGARNTDQARANAAAGSLPALAPELLAGVARLYDTYFRAAIHDRW